MLKCFVASPLVGFTLACQATVGASAHVDSDVAASANTRASEQPRSASLPPAGPTASVQDAATNSPGAMLGARAGLSIAPSTPNCMCLSVIVGQPEDARFTWEGGQPKTNPSSQLVVGVSSKGLVCPQAEKDSLGASYHGYELQGSDVLIQVETAKMGRPIVEGAVIPKPPSGGRILTRAVESKSPYGRGLDGSSPSCIVWTGP
ncbi:MAG TPA: hypothetical protein VIV60_28395 [Polyangiaceae bacterium]